MFFWIIITIIAHLLNAIVFIIDKHLVSKTVMKPVAYAFYSCIFLFVYLALIPFGFVVSEFKYTIIGIALGVLFTFILLVFYKAIQAGESTRIVPAVGGLTPVFTFILAYLFIGERLEITQVIALVLFIFGGFLLSSKISKEHLKIIKGAKMAVLAAFLFAIYYTLMKFLFSHISFLSGFIIIQIGAFLGAVILALPARNRKAIFAPASAAGAMKKEALYLFVPDKILGAVAGFLIPYAISMEAASVTVINSLQAVQYVFLLVFAIILSKKFPSFFKEQIGEKVIKRKIAAIILIGIGLLIISWG
ncbi:DMT family transporter [Patescibacteria group bacterium]|nr:DMT family transporter [Patescibacteria group bacterium]MBU4141404.1 DMT family transporter [Patescibacteria group bacterium]